MEFQEMAEQLKAGFVTEASLAEQKREGALASVATVDAMVVEHGKKIEAAKAEAKAEVLGQVENGDVTAIVEPLKAQIASMTTEMESMKVELQAAKDAVAVEVAKAQAAKDLEFHQELAAVEVDNSALKAKYAPKTEEVVA